MKVINNLDDMCSLPLFLYYQGPNSAITYELIGDETSIEYFEVGTQTGIVRLKQSLVDSSIDEFEVIFIMEKS